LSFETATKGKKTGRETYSKARERIAASNPS
jgi:hypothetical protein